MQAPPGVVPTVPPTMLFGASSILRRCACCRLWSLLRRHCRQCCADVIALDHVSGCSRTHNQDIAPEKIGRTRRPSAVVRNNISLTGCSSANVIVRCILYRYAHKGVSTVRAVRVKADVVACYDVPTGIAAGDPNPIFVFPYVLDSAAVAPPI